MAAANAAPQEGRLENILGHAKGFFGGSPKGPEKKYREGGVQRRDTLSFNILPAEFYPSTWWANFNKVFFRKIGKYARLSDGHFFTGEVIRDGRRIGQIARVAGKEVFHRVIYGTQHGGLEAEVETVQDSPQEFRMNNGSLPINRRVAVTTNLPAEGERGLLQQYNVPLEESWYIAPFKAIPYLLASPWHKFKSKFVNLGRLYRCTTPKVNDSTADEDFIYRIFTGAAGKKYEIADDAGRVLATIKRRPGIKWATAWLKDKWDIDFYETKETFVKQMHGFVSYLQNETRYRLFSRPDEPVHTNSALLFA